MENISHSHSSVKRGQRQNVKKCFDITEIKNCFLSVAKVVQKGRLII